MKRVIKTVLYSIIGLAAIFITVSLVLYFTTKHHLDFDPTNKDFDKIVVYGDVRSSIVVHKKIAEMVYNEKPDMVLFTGDIPANSRNYIHYLQYTIFEDKLWDNFEYYPVRGNHESTYWLYDAFFELPNGKTYYSFDRMGMHFIVLDCWDVFSPLEATQLQWLKEDLEANKDKPISISFHVPLFTSGKYDPYVEPNILSLIEKYNVLFVFSAHVHSYERSSYKGTQFVVTAGGGAPLYPATKHNPYKVVRENIHHYTILTRNGNEYSLKAIDINGNEIDSFSTSIEILKQKRQKDKIK